MTSRPALTKRSYAKPWCSHQDQVALLQQRGLVVVDIAAAAEFLRHLNYYRFSGYCIAFERARHRFVPNTTFEQIQHAYDFDRVLRDLVTEALEAIELDLRSAIAYHFGQHHGAFGHTDPSKFFQTFGHQKWIDKVREEATRSSELFVVHFRNSYSEFPDLPIWMATEVMSFGALSFMFSGMVRQDQKAIARQYRRQRLVMRSWMHHLVYVRNLCAHHARLWDRIWAIKPDLPAGKTWHQPLLPGNNRLFATLLILCSMLKCCPTIASFTEQWQQRVEDLLDKPPAAPQAHALLGLTRNWKTHPTWM